jgi:hypothetical protein
MSPAAYGLNHWRERLAVLRQRVLDPCRRAGTRRLAKDEAVRFEIAERLGQNLLRDAWHHLPKLVEPSRLEREPVEDDQVPLPADCGERRGHRARAVSCRRCATALRSMHRPEVTKWCALALAPSRAILTRTWRRSSRCGRTEPRQVVAPTFWRSSTRRPFPHTASLAGLGERDHGRSSSLDIVPRRRRRRLSA